jgi:hypothetical protein
MSVTLEVYFARMLQNGQAIFRHESYDTLEKVASDVLGVDLQKNKIAGVESPKLFFTTVEIKAKAKPNAALHVGSRCRVALKLSKYNFKSTFEKNLGQNVFGVSATVITINEL